MPPTSETVPTDRAPRVRVRDERSVDRAAVCDVNLRAFGRRDEADLVDALRAEGGVRISLVAVAGGHVAGHVLFTPVSVHSSGGGFEALALGPLAVEPRRQQRGIGSLLVRRGLETARRRGHEIVFVLGHPGYYPRFGFVPAVPLGLRYPRPVPDGAFMVAELRPGSLRGRTGVVRYLPPFDRV